MKSQDNFAQTAAKAKAPNPVLSTRAVPTLVEIELRYTHALIQGALAARLKWLERGDRDWARQVYLATRSKVEATKIPVDTSSAWIDQLIVPIDLVSPLLRSIDKVCERFSEMFEEQADGVKYADHEIDEACDALPTLISHKIARMVSLDGSATDLLSGKKTA